MLSSPRFRFYRIPKTASTWVANVLLSSCSDVTDRQDELGHPHGSPNDYPPSDKFSFAFVRHPLEWWRSYFLYNRVHGWQFENLARKVQADTFEDFLRNVLRDACGGYGRICKRFLGKDLNWLDFVGKQENLVEDLITALTMAGQEFDDKLIRATPPINVTDRRRFQADYTPELAAELMAAEKEIAERFSYDLMSVRLNMYHAR